MKLSKIMQLHSTDLKEYKGREVGMIISDMMGKKRIRLARLICIDKDDEDNYYSVYQYIIKSTLNPSGKSTSFAVIIP